MGAPGTHACAGSGASEAKPNEWSGRACASDEVHHSQLICLVRVVKNINHEDISKYSY